MYSRHGRSSIPDSVVDIVRKRATPRLILLDEALGITFAEADATSVLSGMLNFPEQRISRLPFPIEAAVRAVANSWTEDDLAEQVVIPVSDVVLRISRLKGRDGSCIAVYIEHHKCREDLADAGRRFALTRREFEVLTLILGGLNGAEIAHELNISESTVSDYFKNLLAKTRAKNRADMLAKVLGWNPKVKAEGPRAVRQRSSG